MGYGRATSKIIALSSYISDTFAELELRHTACFEKYSSSVNLPLSFQISQINLRISQCSTLVLPVIGKKKASSSSRAVTNLKNATLTPARLM